MNSSKIFENIIQSIVKIWKKGIVIKPDELSFFESSFGISTFKELRETLNNEDFPEREMMLEYLVFPDQEYSFSTELLLGPKGLSEEKAGQITTYLIQNHSMLKIYDPDKSVHFFIEISPGHIKSFISHIYLTRQIDPDIIKAFEKSVSATDALHARILLRRKNYQLHDAQKKFLVGFIQKSKNITHDFLSIFELFFQILSQVPGSTDIESFFLDRQQQEKNMLIRIKKFEKKKERYNMEYLMLSRYTVPAESFETVFQRLEKLNVIIKDVLGIRSKQDFKPQVQYLGSFDPKKDIKKIIQTLS
ncbi:MAG: hypothetical protein GY707_04360 [Desulfobacteraceae bacterium]|nr:hypothetical protein [Desulfobacteraceae bacterium]